MRSTLTRTKFRLRHDGSSLFWLQGFHSCRLQQVRIAMKPPLAIALPAKDGEDVSRRAHRRPDLFFVFGVAHGTQSISAENTIRTAGVAMIWARRSANIATGKNHKQSSICSSDYWQDKTLFVSTTRRAPDKRETCSNREWLSDEDPKADSVMSIRVEEH